MDSSQTPRPADYPPWVVLHIPHDSTRIPPQVRHQFILDDAALDRELLRMTDHHTHALFAGKTTTAQIVRAGVSRLVVDVERFPNDDLERMARIGMGAIYRMTSDLAPLRVPLREQERAALMAEYYEPHHRLLEQAVDQTIDLFGRAVVLDCHSFPSEALPYERAVSHKSRPDICIGTDEFHTPPELARAMVRAFETQGFSVSLNDPFAGSLVPSSRYGKDARVSGLMIEVNRRLYMNEFDGTSLKTFERLSDQVRLCCISSLNG